MASVRKSFQGTWNIIRFNWQFYVLSFAFFLFALVLSIFLNEPFRDYVFILCALIFLPVIISLIVSLYVYDLSGLYNLNWITNFSDNNKNVIVNINAGFDETSVLLKDKFTNAKYIVFDFYDPLKHTEISIVRARKAYPPYTGTQKITTSKLSLEDNYADKIFLIFAAHEIRNENERIGFFKELNRILKPSGQIIITEHLRDITNFLAYNIGFFHFHSKATWLKTFNAANINLQKEEKLTPLISIFTLVKNGITS